MRRVSGKQVDCVPTPLPIGQPEERRIEFEIRGVPPQAMEKVGPAVLDLGPGYHRAESQDASATPSRDAPRRARHHRAESWDASPRARHHRAESRGAVLVVRFTEVMVTNVLG